MKTQITTLIVGLLALIFVIFINNHATKETILINVTDRTIKDNKYMIFSKNEVFKCSDSFFNLKYNSADIYNLLQPGKSYIVEVNGFRNSFLSTFRNIILVKEVYSKTEDFNCANRFVVPETKFEFETLKYE